MLKRWPLWDSRNSDSLVVIESAGQLGTISQNVVAVDLPPEVLGDNRRQSQRSRMELGLCLSDGFLRPNDLDAHRDDGKRFVVRADETLTAFMELESAIRRLKANCGP
jgi:hypothetical protein